MPWKLLFSNGSNKTIHTIALFAAQGNIFMCKCRKYLQTPKSTNCIMQLKSIYIKRFPSHGLHFNAFGHSIHVKQYRIGSTLISLWPSAHENWYKVTSKLISMYRTSLSIRMLSYSYWFFWVKTLSLHEVPNQIEFLD